MTRRRRLLAYVLLLLCGSSLLWSARDAAAPMWDQSRHAWNALRVAEILERGALHEIPAWRDGVYAVAAYLPAALAHLVFGRSYDVATAAMTLFWTPVLLLSVFSLARRLHGNDDLAGGLAAAWIAASPMVIDFAKDFLLDLPIAALVALALALLVRSGFLADRGGAIAFGAALGSLLLTKAAMPATFLLFPLGYAAWLAWRERRLRAFSVNAASACVIAAAIAAPFYAAGFLVAQRRASGGASGLASTLIASQVANALHEGDPGSLGDSLLFYLRALVDVQARGPLLLFPIAGLVLLALRNRPVAIFAAGSIIALVPWLAFPNKDPRYTLPLLVFLAVAAGGLAPRTKRARIAAAVAGAAVATACVLAVQWGIGSDRGGYLRGRPRSEPPLAAAVLEFIERDSRSRGANWTPVVQLDLGVADSRFFNSWNFQHYRLVLGRRVDVVPDPGLPLGAARAPDYVLVGRRATEEPRAPTIGGRLARTWPLPEEGAAVDLWGLER
ncbi:MAG TPA: hypothetical protein VJ826_03415 [Candidatus Polarisedimenticolaceae bacterium]|nr:hypothetical protein [Candidatus Polarisedimenticolaceae bacterium]